MNVRPRVARIALLAIAVAIAGCGSSPEGIAEVVEVGGAVEKSPSAEPPSWVIAASGDRLARGAGVRTGPAARARLNVRGGGTLRMGPSSVVWLGASPSAPTLQLEAGDAEIEAGDAEVTVGTRSGGRARVRPGGKVRVERGQDGEELVVEVGAALIERSDGAPLEVAAGTRSSLGRERPAIDAGAPIDAGVETAAIVDAGAPEVDAGAEEPEELSVDIPGGRLALDRQPSTADVALPVGESATIHDPDAPSHVRLQIGALCGGGPALVEVRRGRSRIRVLGKETAVVSLSLGKHSYAVRCRTNDRFEARPRARGVLRVVRDAGRRVVDAAAPRNVIEVDGRSYQVLYQNRRPVLVVRWPDAPRATGYTLTVKTGGRVRTYPGAKAEVTLPSGTVDEGTHLLSFTAKGSEKSSPSTRLVLDFDNAAPVAQLREPASPAAWSGNQVQVAGVATEGSAVSVGGTPLDLDVHQRFTAQVEVPGGQRAIAVRITQRGGRVHYYVRRRP
jgi:hypothetical protein